MVIKKLKTILIISFFIFLFVAIYLEIDFLLDSDFFLITLEEIVFISVGFGLILFFIYWVAYFITGSHKKKKSNNDGNQVENKKSKPKFYWLLHVIALLLMGIALGEAIFESEVHQDYLLLFVMMVFPTISISIHELIKTYIKDRKFINYIENSLEEEEENLRILEENYGQGLSQLEDRKRQLRTSIYHKSYDRTWSLEKNVEETTSMLEQNLLEIRDCKFRINEYKEIYNNLIEVFPSRLYFKDREKLSYIVE